MNRTTALLAGVSLFATSLAAPSPSPFSDLPPAPVPTIVTAQAYVTDSQGTPWTGALTLSLEASAGTQRFHRRHTLFPDPSGFVDAAWTVEGLSPGDPVTVYAHSDVNEVWRPADPGHFHLSANAASSGRSDVDLTPGETPGGMLADAGVILLEPLAPRASVRIQDPTSSSATLYYGHGAGASAKDFMEGGHRSLVIPTNQEVLIYTIDGFESWVLTGETASGRRIPRSVTCCGTSGCGATSCSRRPMRSPGWASTTERSGCCCTGRTTRVRWRTSSATRWPHRAACRDERSIR